MAGVRLPLGVSQAIPWTPGGSNPEPIFKKKKSVNFVILASVQVFAHIVSTAALIKAHTSTREERAEGSAASALYERDYNATSSPTFFPFFSPVETSDHAVSFYISDGFFSHVALCCNGTSTRENTHGKLCDDSSQSQLRGLGWGSIPHYSTAGKSARIFHSSLIFFMV